MRIAFTVLLTLHGLIHQLGFLKGFQLAKVDTLRHPISRTAGAFWLLSSFGFALVAILFFGEFEPWWMVCLPFLLTSQTLILLSWSDAKFGSLVNLVILLVLLVNFAEWLPSSFGSMYHNDAQRLVRSFPESSDVIVDSDLSRMPPLLQAFLRRVGVVGRPRVRGFTARFHGRFRNGLRGPWMSFESRQHNSIASLERLFLMRASLYGVPIEAYHNFVGANAHFRVRALSVVQMVNGQGAILNQSETVTIFNDICILAPAALIDLPVRWTTIDAHRVTGQFTRGDQTVSAQLTFDAQGDLVNFVSQDRYYSEDGAEGRLLPWLTPMRQHRDYGGIRLPQRGDATWRTEHGDMVYGEFNLEEIRYLPAATAVPAI